MVREFHLACDAVGLPRPVATAVFGVGDEGYSLVTGLLAELGPRTLLVVGLAVAACNGAPPGLECRSSGIVGGRDRAELVAADPRQEAAIALLAVLDPAGAVLGTCTGTLVRSDVVLTAAHCLPQAGESMQVVFAAAEEVRADAVAAQQTAAHPSLDLGVIRLSRAVPDTVTPVGVDFGAAPTPGAPVQLSGWGATEVTAPGERRFAVSQVTVSDGTEFRVSAQQRAAACAGDSGAPALVRDSEGRLAVAGVLSGGSKDCAAWDVYTVLSPARSWLEANGVSSLTRAEVLADCAMLGESGRCFGRAALWCGAGSVQHETCVDGFSCGYDLERHGFRCVADGTGPCGAVTDRGACDGDQRLVCREGEIVAVPCEACGASCKLSVADGSAICSVSEF